MHAWELPNHRNPARTPHPPDGEDPVAAPPRHPGRVANRRRRHPPLDGSTRAGVSPEALTDPRRIADTVLFLANQDARSATHGLQLTPLAETWTA